MTMPKAGGETAGGKLARDVAAYIRARKALIRVESKEAERVERSLLEAATFATSRILAWDIVRGAVELDGSPAYLNRGPKGEVVSGQSTLVDPKQTKAPPQILAFIDKERVRLVEAHKAMVKAVAEGADPRPLEGFDRIVWVLRDFDPYIKADPMIRRYLKNLAEDLCKTPREGACSIVLLTTSPDVPPDLADSLVSVKWSFPDRAELSAILDETICSLPESKRADAAPNGAREAAIEAAVGLSANAAHTIFKRSLVTRGGKIDPKLVGEEKRKVVGAIKGLTWYDPDPRGLDALGGLDNLKTWLRDLASAFSPAARIFGIDYPKGIILVGPPGCGKSLTAKAVATAWGVPLLRFDVAACKGGIVGQSEAQIREVYALAETVGKCVLWIDEGEKAFGGAGKSNDGKVSDDQLGSFLTWQEECKEPVFTLMTANNVKELPPELLRKGRFDELWYTDLPTLSERVEILRVTLRKKGRELPDADLRRVALACERDGSGFAGVEVAYLVKAGLLAAFNDGARALRADDLVAAARCVVPLAKTMAPQILANREWGKVNARPASREEPATHDGARSAFGARAQEIDVD